MPTSQRHLTVFSLPTISAYQYQVRTMDYEGSYKLLLPGTIFLQNAKKKYGQYLGHKLKNDQDRASKSRRQQEQAPEGRSRNMSSAYDGMMRECVSSIPSIQYDGIWYCIVYSLDCVAMYKPHDRIYEVYQ